MELLTRTQGAYTIISPKGDVDFHSSPELREEIMKSIEKDWDLLIDMSAVGFIDSSAIATLVEGLQRAKSKGRIFSLASLQDAPRQVLQLTRLDEVFSIHESANDYLVKVDEQ